MKRATGRLAAAAGMLGRVTGLGSIAAAIVDAKDGAVGRLAAEARRLGVPESRIRKALRLVELHERMTDLAALLMPFLPSPAIIRLLAGRPVAPQTTPRPAQGRIKSGFAQQTKRILH